MRKGFTLIELMIVIGIVAMLSVLSVNGYLQYRKGTVLTLSVDNFLSQVAQLRSQTIYGDVSGERFSEIASAVEQGNEEIESSNGNAFCFGLNFEAVDGGYAVKSFRQGFSNLYFWNGEKWLYEGCKGELDFLPLELDEEMHFAVSEDLVENFYLRFAPPFGAFESDLGLDIFELKMYYGNDPETDVSLFFDLKNAKFGRR